MTFLVGLRDIFHSENIWNSKHYWKKRLLLKNLVQNLMSKMKNFWKILKNNKLANQSRTFGTLITSFLAKMRQNCYSDFLICTNFEDIIVDQIIVM